jgi:hypothetical protein
MWNVKTLQCIALMRLCLQSACIQCTAVYSHEARLLGGTIADFHGYNSSSILCTLQAKPLFRNSICYFSYSDPLPPLFLWLFYVGDSVADPGCPGPGSASTTLCIFKPNKLYKVLKNKIRDVRPGFWILYLFPSRIQGSKRHRIPNPIRNTSGRERFRKWRKKCLVY